VVIPDVQPLDLSGEPGRLTGQLPGELHRRNAHLPGSLSTDLKEYEAIERELQSISALPVSPLDERVRTVVRRTILPSQERRQRRERWMFALLIALAILSFSPVGPGLLIWGYFHVLGSVQEFSVSSIVIVLALDLIILTTIFRVSYSYFSHHMSARALRYLNQCRWYIAAGGFALGIGFIAWGFHWRQEVLSPYLFQTSHPGLYAAITFHIGVLMLAVGIVALFLSIEALVGAKRT